MKKRICICLFGLLLVGTPLYASGDLTVNGKLKLGNGLTLSGSQIGLGGGTLQFVVYDNIAFQTNDIDIMYLNGVNGNVGINTQNPSYQLHVQGTIASLGLQQLSDINYKQNILPLEGSLKRILGVRGVSYEWKPDKYKGKDGGKDRRHLGVIAQDIENILPEVVKTETDGTKSVAYMEIIPILIEAIKEQQQEIEQLKKALSLK